MFEKVEICVKSRDVTCEEEESVPTHLAGGAAALAGRPRSLDLGYDQ